MTTRTRLSQTPQEDDGSRMQRDLRPITAPGSRVPPWRWRRERAFTFGLPGGLTAITTRFGWVRTRAVIAAVAAASASAKARARRRYPYPGFVPLPPGGLHGEAQPLTGAAGLTKQPGATPRGFPAVNFWNSLDPGQRQAFAAAAQDRTFARGARLMREGELENHVMVILNGWTQVSVHEFGSERVIAERGPGQLVGERAALRVNVRSATVIALEKVRALVMKTEDFAGFITDHPRVLDIVESQIYGRLIEGPAGHGRDGWPDTFPPGQVAHPSAEEIRQHLPAGENCTVLRTDVVGFGAHHRNDHDRQIIRRASLDMMRSSLGPIWERCISEDRGDGLLIIVPPAIPTANVLERLHRDLPSELRVHNRTYSEPVRIRLRVALIVGPVMSDTIGMSGQAIISAARLLDAPVLKEAMASSGASLGIIASDFVYETAIKHAEGWADPDKYKAVQANVKESSIPAWMQIIDPATR